MIGAGSQSMGFTRSQPQLIQGDRMPAPSKGVDTRAAIGDMNSENCVYAYNLVPEEFGLKLRPGFREHQIDLESVTGLGVKSIASFEGLTGHKIFAVTNEGIWDVTVLEATPVLKFTFTVDTTAEAGHGVFLNYITQAGTQLMFYADSENGLYTYTESTDAWTVTAGITGVAVADIAFIMVHKQRIWLIEREATSAWYLPIASIAGAATEFVFGAKFQHGGVLSALINWSVDGGIGVDDYLVAVSSAGDVIPYKGSDPSIIESTTDPDGWAVVGSYYIGELPKGRRVYNENSGELYLLSSFGLIAMSDLLQGVEAKDSSSVNLTYPIASTLRSELALTGSSYGWEPVFLPTQGVLLITSPSNATTGKSIQYSMSLAMEGWGFWRGVPITAVMERNKKIYFGTVDNRIMVMDVNRDNQLIDTLDIDYLGIPIEFSILSAYNDGGSPAMFKLGQFVRPDFLSSSPITFQVRIFYDYNIEEEVFAFPTAAVSLLSLWDTAVWDTAKWESGALESQHSLKGVNGMGRTAAIALRGESGDALRLVAYDIMWQNGGLI